MARLFPGIAGTLMSPGRGKLYFLVSYYPVVRYTVYCYTVYCYTVFYFAVLYRIGGLTALADIRI